MYMSDPEAPNKTIDIIDYVTGIGNSARDAHNTHTW